MCGGLKYSYLCLEFFLCLSWGRCSCSSEKCWARGLIFIDFKRIYTCALVLSWTETHSWSLTVGLHGDFPHGRSLLKTKNSQTSSLAPSAAWGVLIRKCRFALRAQAPCFAFLTRCFPSWISAYQRVKKKANNNFNRQHIRSSGITSVSNNTNKVAIQSST